jgi:PAS domain S-box-containing protein
MRFDQVLSNNISGFYQTLNAAQAKLREYLMGGSSLKEIIEKVVTVIQENFKDALCGVELYDPIKNTLKFLSGPNLPKEFPSIVENVPIDPPQTACALAVLEKKRVIVTDNSFPISTSIKLSQFGLQSCWAEPIFSFNKTDVLGVFAIYFSYYKKPDQREVYLLESLAGLIGTALEWELVYSLQKEVEERLDKTTNLAQHILENVNEGIIGIDKSGVNTFTNKMASQLLGYSANELINKNAHQLIHHTKCSGEPYSLEECPIYGVLKTGVGVERSDEIFWRKDGTNFPVEYTCNPIFENGEVTGAVLSFRDITNRILTQKKLKENDEVFRNIAENSSDMISVVDPEGQIEYVSPSIENIFGFTQEEVIGDNAFDYYHPQDYQKLKNSYSYIISNMYQTHFPAITYRLKTKEGNYKWVESKGRIVVEESGKVKIHSVTRDISDRKNVEDKLEKESEYFKAVLENVSDGIIACDENGKIFFWNEAFNILHSLPYDDITFDNIAQKLDLFQAGGKNQLKKEEVPLYRAFVNEEYFDNQEIWTGSNGEKGKILIDDGGPIFNREGKKIGALVVIHDVTKIREAEEILSNTTDKLKESEKQFRTLAEYASDIISVISTDGKVVYISPSVELFFGLKPDQIIGQSVYPFYHSDDLEKMKAVFSKVIQSNQSITVTFRSFNKFNEMVWFETTARKIQNEKDPYPLIHMVNRDVTLRKQIEDQLEKETEYLKAILDNVNEGIIACNDKGEIIIFNKIVRKLHGLHNIEFKTTHWPNNYYLFNPTNGNEIIGSELPIQRALAGETIQNEHYKICPPNLEEKIVLIDGQPIINKEGKKLGAVIVVHDITESQKAQDEIIAKNKALATANKDLKSAEESLRQVNAELESRVNERTKEVLNEKLEIDKRNQELSRINNDLDNFIYTASHDLKAPIINIEGLINIVKTTEAYGNPETKDVIDMMVRSVERFKKTISELTEITKVQKSFESNAEWVELLPLINEVSEGLKPFIEETQAVIHKEFDPTCKIWFSRKNLRSILYNLLSNAIKYRSKQRIPAIKIYTELDSNYFVLNVEDNGLGISTHHIHKIFTMFKRLHDHVEGTGVGLYIVKRIVENAGGKIQVESELGKGTTFKIYFPLH